MQGMVNHAIDTVLSSGQYEVTRKPEDMFIPGLVLILFKEVCEDEAEINADTKIKVESEAEDSGSTCRVFQASHEDFEHLWISMTGFQVCLNIYVHVEFCVYMYYICTYIHTYMHTHV